MYVHIYTCVYIHTHNPEVHTLFFSGRRHYISEKRIKMYMYQLLRSIDYMHRYRTIMLY